ncbi:MAG TPA: ATP-binding protein [Firmicutes bacterium]|jgi:Mrp family chromosome partitioning ATPase|nr:ATP-binding protein [Bacillota bacterium]
MVDNSSSIFEKAKLHPKSRVKHVIAVLSGKGGVGKSFVTALLATHLTQEGFRVGILDADVLGPSIPKIFHLSGKAEGGEGYILPQMSRGEIQVISAAMLLDGHEEPILWRGPLVSDLVRQFYTDVFWHEVDYLLIDMPPGTGDIALTTFQKIPVSGIVIVTSPQQLVANIVAKAVKMASMLRIPVLGIVENMAYVKCPHCGTIIDLFGSSYSKDLADRYHVPLLAQLPVMNEMSQIIDEGNFETMRIAELEEAVKALIALE